MIPSLFRRAPTVADWSARHLAETEKQLSSGAIVRHTYDERRRLLEHIGRHLGAMRMDKVQPPDVMAALHSVQAEGHDSTAKQMRRLLIRLYYEAIEAGEIPAHCNPAASVRAPRAPVLRNRLTLAQWQQMLIAAAAGPYPYLYRAMLLAVSTGQRRGDIVRMRFDHIVDGCLRVEQQKTGARVAIPLALHCRAIGKSVSEAIDLCRDERDSPYLIHATLDVIGPIHASSLSIRFRELYQAQFGAWQGEGTMPTFHEQRSLAERLYADQGVDTRKLLGHRRQSMTDRYNSDRRLREWITISLGSTT